MFPLHSPPNSVPNKSQDREGPRQTLRPASPFNGLLELFWFLNKTVPSFTPGTYLFGQPLKGMKQKHCPARNSCSWQKWKAKIFPHRSNLTDTTQIKLSCQRKRQTHKPRKPGRKLFWVPFTKNCHIFVLCYQSLLELSGFSLLIILLLKVFFSLADKLSLISWNILALFKTCCHTIAVYLSPGGNLKQTASFSHCGPGVSDPAWIAGVI